MKLESPPSPGKIDFSAYIDTLGKEELTSFFKETDKRYWSRLMRCTSAHPISTKPACTSPMVVAL